jgi:hypothetical protein
VNRGTRTFTAVSTAGTAVFLAHAPGAGVDSPDALVQNPVRERQRKVKVLSGGMMMIRTNKQYLVEKAVCGKISSPRIPLKNPWLIDPSGKPRVMPGTGGITYNVSVGDSALDFAGDHIEPGVSVTLKTPESDVNALGGLSILTCIGNEAQAMTGKAAGSKGVVTGKHGGVEHVIIDFPRAALEKMCIGDTIQIRAVGQGLELKDFPDIHVMNIDPGLLVKLGITTQNKQLIVPVTHVIPASIMGSGVGSRHSYSGDYDIQLGEKESIRKFGLQNLRIGDLIAVNDADCRFGRTIRSGALSIGVIVHGACTTSGHGPGVTVLMTTVKKMIVPKIEETANLSRLMNIGREKKSGRPRSRRRR